MGRPANLRTFAPGDPIVEPDDRAESLFILHSGAVEVRGAEETTSRLGPGEMFGEAALILGRTYGLRAVALSEAELVVVSLPDLQRLCLENPDFTFRLIRHLAGQALPKEVEVEAGRRERAARLAAVILDLAGEGEPPVRVEGRLLDLAEAAHVSMQDAYVWVQRWLEQRMLRLADDQLSLVEPDALRAVAEPPPEVA